MTSWRSWLFFSGSRRVVEVTVIPQPLPACGGKSSSWCKVLLDYIQFGRGNQISLRHSREHHKLSFQQTLHPHIQTFNPYARVFSRFCSKNPSPPRTNGFHSAGECDTQSLVPDHGFCSCCLPGGG